jgi:prepilin-type N-terminal cleavage/methylation domain-containing protein
MTLKTTCQAGFTLVEIMIVVVLIGMLATIAIPNFIKARSTSQTSACINNLRQVDDAIQQWALETKKSAAAAVDFTDISGYLKNVVICPSGGIAFSDSYTISDVGSKPVCQKVPGAHIFRSIQAANIII